MVARQATERIQDLRYTLRSFGVPVEKTAWLFGDNKSVVTSSMIPHSMLSKRWNALSYHKVCEAVAGGWLRFEHLPGTEDPADIFTKPLAWHMLRTFVEPLLFWKGDTAAPSGSPNPEGSDTRNIANPGRGTTRNTSPRNATDETRGEMRNELNLNPVSTIGQAGIPQHDALWNNQWAVLMEDDPSETDRLHMDSSFVGIQS